MINSKILIVEDEILIAEYIKSLLQHFGFTEIFMAHNSIQALQSIALIMPDLVLLDLHLINPLDGIDIAKKIDASFNIPYLFVTANNDILIIQEAIETKTLAYISKPIKKNDLFAAVQLGLRSTAKSTPFISLKVSDGIIKKVLFQDILYIEGTGNYITLNTQKEKIVTRQSLDWVEKLLPENQFMRIHRSYIINLNAISQKIANHIFIADQEIPISRTYLPKLAAHLK